jgi:hypothetical protein
MYKFESLVYASTMNLDNSLRRKIIMNVLDLLLQNHPRRVWLYVKHQRWMLSDEYAMLQEVYIGSAPLFAAKTQAFFRAGPEDEVVMGECFVTFHVKGDTLMRRS